MADILRIKIREDRARSVIWNSACLNGKRPLFAVNQISILGLYHTSKNIGDQKLHNFKHFPYEHSRVWYYRNSWHLKFEYFLNIKCSMRHGGI